LTISHFLASGFQEIHTISKGAGPAAGKKSEETGRFVKIRKEASKIV